MDGERRSALTGLLCAGFAGFAGLTGLTGLTGFAPSSAAAAAPGHTARAGAGPRPPASLLGDEIRRLPTSRKVLALTFNAAWDADGIDTVLAELRRRKLPATFFPTGAFAEAHPAAVRSIADAGHGLGNHSYSHPYFDDLSTAERADEVRGADAAIRAASGTEPLPFFRFPYSSTTPESITDVNDLGYAAIEFSADTNGYLGPQGGMSVDKAVGRAVDAFAPGAIIQMHVGSNGSGVVLDAEALPLIVDAALAEGYEVIDLRQFLEAAAGVR
ncbi:polysaccharide deacetylase family protein [Streptomyces kutzneri]|uniref:polysaccharide deacetylase family protein n=1 Tax=Streptomyces kutzneri TaxID=3051179 RepID=UPI0028D74D68|nr:polysaccharide deacetylase family protein [Streptomyces sp. DSM 40907]